ncbi:hypothetical protein GCM10007973_29630 [Polymorphobacter multimanifer]|uniref:YCII-related domain-containing protein n=1 Tax=Polymorphobacter multimanifer TaxID=1070431 RepID=A0A841LAQ5_9SPHN|nr:YciI family protein [Polymorphobacter multimanifer]MBB6226895.1 hypothetical protein [Polymorphobacter multimanifer]GGI91428.1 hypothetical protein GCM10007973_29630 [Polymorphobacter multimanifer]
MRVMVLVKATPASETESMDPSWAAQMMAAMDRYNADLRAAGILVMAEGLKPSAHGQRVTIDGDSRTIVEGPFPDPETLVAGFWIWEVETMEEAMAWAMRCPNPMPTSSQIEVRPFY